MYWRACVRKRTAEKRFQWAKKADAQRRFLSTAHNFEMLIGEIRAELWNRKVPMPARPVSGFKPLASEPVPEKKGFWRRAWEKVRGWFSRA